MEFIDIVLEFGLTRQEATLYEAMLLHGELTGYEAAKLTGISRSNTYNALAGLVEKGAAHICFCKEDIFYIFHNYFLISPFIYISATPSCTRDTALSEASTLSFTSFHPRSARM